MSPRPRAAIRPARRADLRAITGIYNDAVLKTTATFDVAPRSAREQRAWFAAHGPRRPVLVAEEAGRVAGWVALSSWSGRCGYADAAELSVYVAEPARGRGLGRRLAREALRAGRRAGLHTVLSRVAGESAASLRLHKALGFSKIGVMREVGRKFGRRIDVHLFQKMLGRGRALRAAGKRPTIVS